MLNEKFIASSENLGSILWANGTTDTRYDFVHHYFVNPSKTSEAAKIDFAHPMYLTNNVPYIFACVESHITKDTGVQKDKKYPERHKRATNIHGIVVFVKLKSNVKLFDFEDPFDYSIVFGTDENPEDFASIFKGVEPYFAFNTGVTNTVKDKVPVEFSIAQKILLYFKSKMKPYKKDGSIMKTFFGSGTISNNNSDGKSSSNSFINLFKNADESAFDIKVTQNMYDEFISYYKKWIEMNGGQIEKLDNGRERYRNDDWYGQIGIWSKYPDKLSNEQISKVNCYIRLLKFCITYRDLLHEEDKALFDDITSNSDSDKRVGFVDLLQACLYLAIDISGEFSGFYCPEYVGAKSKGIQEEAPAIALFTKDAIEEVKDYSFAYVNEAISYATKEGIPGCNQVLTALRDGIESYEKHLAKKKEDAKKAKEKAEEEKQRRAAKGEYLIDDIFILQTLKACGNNTDAKRECEKQLKSNKGKYVKRTPNQIAKEAIKHFKKIEIQNVQKQLEIAKRQHNIYNIERLTDKLYALQRFVGEY